MVFLMGIILLWKVVFGSCYLKNKQKKFKETQIQIKNILTNT